MPAPSYVATAILPTYSDFRVSGRVELRLKDSPSVLDMMSGFQDFLKTAGLLNVLALRLDSKLVFTCEGDGGDSVGSAISRAREYARSANDLNAVILVLDNGLRLVVSVDFHARRRFHNPRIELNASGRPIEFTRGDGESDEQFAKRMADWWRERTPEDGRPSNEKARESVGAIRDKLASLLQHYVEVARARFDIEKVEMSATTEGTPPLP